MFNELALFAGAGGGLLASQHLLGWRTICYVENAVYPVRVLQARIRDGLLDDAPIWGEVKTFDGRPWAGSVDIITAGFPCQPWATGGKYGGEEDPRNLWPDTLRVIGEVRPTWVLLENSPKLLQYSHKLGRKPYIECIVAQLAHLGYVGRWGCLSAAGLGFDHKRRRLWVVAHAGGEGREVVLRDDVQDGAAHHEEEGVDLATVTLESVWNRLSRLEQRLGQPSVWGADDGLAHRVDRLGVVGEGQVPAVVRAAWRLLNDF
jgi:DNA (cytosine-5)-methyltransferase 1